MSRLGGEAGTGLAAPASAGVDADASQHPEVQAIRQRGDAASAGADCLAHGGPALQSRNARQGPAAPCGSATAARRAVPRPAPNPRGLKA